MANLDFSQAPFIVFWESTQACDLSCLHCRASAQPSRHPLELTTEEGYRLLEQIKSFGDPLFVITGGDPMKREDIYDLVSYGSSLGLRVAMSPSATPLLSPEALARLKECGVQRLSISIDGPRREIHDAFRRTEGAFQCSMDVLHACQELGLPFQVNTTVTRHTLNALDEFPPLLEGLKGLSLWSVFFLVPTGRGRREDEISPSEYEEVLQWLYRYSRKAPFDIKTTAATHFRRVILQQRRLESAENGTEPRAIAGFSSAPGRAPKGVNDANGLVFISHTGNVCPSGFLPLIAGNVRLRTLPDIYRNSALFRALRNPDLLKGKCGACEYKRVCGGSRARAFGMTGDPFAEEPFCAYVPPHYVPSSESGEEAAALAGASQGPTTYSTWDWFEG
ncbi:MAG TPA: TIGR04053 family radical SAM/SPASM domain-containing protein [Armatimonadota bacterium]